MRDGCPKGGGRRRRHGSGCKRTGCTPLSECYGEGIYMIVANQNKQSMEMGLYGGARVRVIKNTIESPNMVVGVNESRYMLNKETAKQIMVKEKVC